MPVYISQESISSYSSSESCWGDNSKTVHGRRIIQSWYSDRLDHFKVWLFKLSRAAPGRSSYYFSISPCFRLPFLHVHIPYWFTDPPPWNQLSCCTYVPTYSLVVMICLPLTSLKLHTWTFWICSPVVDWWRSPLTYLQWGNAQLSHLLNSVYPSQISTECWYASSYFCLTPSHFLQ